MSDAGDFLESFSVTCPRCDCRFQPEVRLTSYFAKCPDCSEPVRVPASAEVEDDWQREKASESDGETYRLALPTDWDSDAGNFASSASGPQAPPDVHDDNLRDRSSRSEPAADSGPAQTPEPNPKLPSESTATCPACGANFEVPPSDQPQVVLCPECLEDVPISPTPTQPPTPPPDSPAETANNDEEEIQVSDPAPSASRESTIPWESYLGEPADAAEAGRKSSKKKRKKPAEAEIAPGANPRRGPKPEKHVDDVMAEVRQVEEEPLPEWTFFTGVTDFLLRPEVLVRWIYASIGVCLLGWLCALAVYFYREFPFALPFFLLPLFWIAMMTLSYTAACSMPILLETAAGNDKVEGWPDPVMKEQAADLLYLSFLLLVAEVAAFFLAQFVSVLFEPEWLVALVLAFLIYPVVLLSSLEANSPYVPLTLPILKSLKTVTWAWGAFYGLSLGLLLVWVLPLVWAFGQSGGVQFVSMILIAPLTAGWCFLYARLLGRLAWRASIEVDDEDEEEDENTPEPKPKKKKPKSTESSGELQAAR